MFQISPFQVSFQDVVHSRSEYIYTASVSSMVHYGITNLTTINLLFYLFIYFKT